MDPEVRAGIQRNGASAVQRMRQLLEDDAAWGPNGWMKPREQILLASVAQDRAFGKPEVLAINHSHQHGGLIEARASTSTTPSLRAVQSRLPEKLGQGSVIDGQATSAE